MSKYAVIQFACNLNAITYFFMPVKMCCLILDYSDCHESRYNQNIREYIK
jgi:hypothetical protein